MTVSYSSPRFSALDNNGNPLAGGKLYTYLTGTTTPATTYQDAAGSTPNANPVILNSRGEAIVFLTVGQQYTFLLTDPSGGTIWTQDNIDGAVGSSLGAAGLNYSQAGTGAVARTIQSRLRDTVNVFDFMTAAQIADVQANTLGQDVTTAVRNAMAFGVLNSKHNIFFPRGSYKLTSTLQISVSGLGLIGEFNDRGTNGGTELSYYGTGPCIQNGVDDGNPWDANEYNGPQGLRLEHMSIRHRAPDTNLLNGKGQYKNGGYGLKDWRGGDMYLTNVTFENFQYGFWGVNSDINTCYRTRGNYNSVFAYIGPRSDQNVWEDWYGFYNDTVFDIDRATDTWLRQPVLNDNGVTTTYPINIRKGTTRVHILEPWLEFLGGAAAGINAFIGAGITNGYNSTTASAVGITVTDAFLYTNTLGSGSPHAVALLELGAALRVKVQEPVAPAGQSLNCDYIVTDAAGTSYDANSATCRIHCNQANIGNAWGHLGSGTPGVYIEAWGFGQLTNSNATGRQAINNDNPGTAAGADSLRFGQESTVGAFYASAVNMPATTAQQDILRMQRAQLDANAMPTTGYYRAGDFVRNITPVVAGGGGSQYIITGWVRLTSGNAHVLNTDWSQSRVLTGT